MSNDGDPVLLAEDEMDEVFAAHHARALSEMDRPGPGVPESLSATMARVVDLAGLLRRPPSVRETVCRRCREPVATAVGACERCDGAVLLDLELLDARIPRRYREAPVRHAAVQRWVQALLGGADRWLLLCGITGSGKTEAMYGAAREAVRQGWREEIRWVNAAQLLIDLRPGGERSREGAHPGMDDLTTVALLLLDDLGAYKHSEFAEEQIGLLLNWRWEERRPTIVTTNYLPDKLAEVLGDRVASRIDGCSDIVILPPTDYRRAGQR